MNYFDPPVYNIDPFPGPKYNCRIIARKSSRNTQYFMISRNGCVVYFLRLTRETHYCIIENNREEKTKYLTRNLWLVFLWQCIYTLLPFLSIVKTQQA